MRQMTHDRSVEWNLLSKCQVPSFNGFGFMMFRKLEGKASVADFFSNSGNEEGVCRKALATLGLLINFILFV